MLFDEIFSMISHRFPVLREDKPLMPIVWAEKQTLVDLALFLRDTEGLYFDSLSCLTGLDKGEHFEVAYNFYSIPYHHSLCVKSKTPKSAPTFPTLSHLWATANWHEREAFDLLGIGFEGHPDLRRILLPTDWQGHPLRKDYSEQEIYHGIKVKY